MYYREVLDTTTLWRTATVVRYWRHVLDLGDLDAEVVQGAHSRLTAWAWALDTHFQVLHTALDCNFASGFSCNLGCKRGRFTRTLEACTTRSRPRQRIALTVGDGEGSVHVGDALSDVFLNFFADACCCGAALLLSHDRFLLFLERLCGLARTFAGTCIGAGTLTSHRQTFTVTHATVAAQVHQTLDVHGQLTAQIAFNDKLRDFVTQLLEFVIVQVLDLFIGRNTRGVADLLRTRTANTVDRRQADNSVLMVGDINPCNTCHSLFLYQ